MELEVDFRTAYGNFGHLESFDSITAERVFDLLFAAKVMLEQDAVDLLTGSSVLDQIERLLVWLLPPHYVLARGSLVLSALKRERNGEERQLQSVLAEMLKSEPENGYAFAELRSVLDEAIGVVNRAITERQISAGLQIERLRILRIGGIVAILLLLLVAPIVSAVPDATWAWLSLSAAPLISGWLAAIGIAAMGAVGGFLSGLLQVRSTKVTLFEYQESVLLALLRPVVGALVALILFILLSWQILPGIKVENAGTYVLLAFLSGFSERYFLRLLHLEPDEQKPDRAAVAVESQVSFVPTSKLDADTEMADSSQQAQSQALPTR